MKKIASTRRRFGYRRVGVLLERKGMTMNPKKRYRLCSEAGLSVKRRRGRKRARGSRSSMSEATRPNQRWSLDFLANTFAASRKCRILAVNDDCCCENLCLAAPASQATAWPGNWTRWYGSMENPLAWSVTTAPSSPAARA